MKKGLCSFCDSRTAHIMIGEVGGEINLATIERRGKRCAGTPGAVVVNDKRGAAR